MEVPIYSIKGKASKKSAQLPDAFSEPVRLDLIRKAVRLLVQTEDNHTELLRVLDSGILFLGLVKVEVWQELLAKMEAVDVVLKHQILSAVDVLTLQKLKKIGALR